jgi:hypothetical protein
MPFSDIFQDGSDPFRWQAKEVTPGNELVIFVPNVPDTTGATFECTARNHESALSALFILTVTQEGGGIACRATGVQTALAAAPNLVGKTVYLYIALDVTDSGGTFTYYRGWFTVGPKGAIPSGFAGLLSYKGEEADVLDFPLTGDAGDYVDLVVAGVIARYTWDTVLETWVVMDTFGQADPALYERLTALEEQTTSDSPSTIIIAEASAQRMRTQTIMTRMVQRGVTK